MKFRDFLFPCVSIMALIFAGEAVAKGSSSAGGASAGSSKGSLSAAASPTYTQADKDAEMGRTTPPPHVKQALAPLLSSPACRKQCH